jgi:hypothetical protein
MSLCLNFKIVDFSKAKILLNLVFWIKQKTKDSRSQLKSNLKKCKASFFIASRFKKTFFFQ